MDVASAYQDLAAEAAVLRDLIERHPAAAAEAVTPFYNWRVRDTISHMVTIDRLARLSMGEPEQFAIELARFAEGIKPTDPAAPRTDVFRRIAAYETSRLDILSFRQLLAAWEVGLAELGEVAKANSDNPKVSWFGAPMRLGTLLNARQMEVSGYGQDVFDLCRVERPEGDRLRNVAEFAVRTFSFNFSNRGCRPPPIGRAFRWRPHRAPPGSGTKGRQRAGSKVRPWTSAWWRRSVGMRPIRVCVTPGRRRKPGCASPSASPGRRWTVPRPANARCPEPHSLLRAPPDQAPSLITV